MKFAQQIINEKIIKKVVTPEPFDDVQYVWKTIKISDDGKSYKKKNKVRIKVEPEFRQYAELRKPKTQSKVDSFNRGYERPGGNVEVIYILIINHTTFSF